MRARSLTFRLTATATALVFVAMLLINFVACGLWYRHMRGEHGRQLQALVAGVDEIQPTEGVAPPDQLVLLRVRAEAAGHCLFVFFPDLGRAPLSLSCPEDAMALMRAQSAMHLAGKGNGAEQPAVLGWHDQRLVALQHNAAPDQAVLVAVEGDARAVYRVWQAQPVIFLYIAANTIILGTLAFLRFSRQLRRPLKRLIAIAENYRDSGGPLSFPEQPQLSELNQLSYSLNNMMRRIEEGRLQLRAHTEERLQHQAQMLRAEKLAATGRLSAGLAHEIGNPLGVVQGYLELLRMESLTREERQEFVTLALAEVGRIHRLIRQLLDSTRSGGQVQEEDLCHLVTGFCTTLAQQHLLHGIHLDYEIPAHACIVRTDPVLLRQVLLNCILNAVDAINEYRQDSQGRICLSIQEITGPDKQGYKLVVADNGGGMRQEVADAAFDPFFTTKDLGKGTGLGLSVSLGIMRSMGGDMELLSKERIGTEAVIHFYQRECVDS